MNRRTALKLLALGPIYTALPTPASDEVNDFLDRHWEDMSRQGDFTEWLRVHAPLKSVRNIVVAGKPKTGRTNLLTFLVLHYANEVQRAKGDGFATAAQDFINLKLDEITLNREFTYGSLGLEHTYKADLIFLTERTEGIGPDKWTAFGAQVLKNRYGADNMHFHVSRMPAYDMQNFALSVDVPSLRRHYV